MSFAAVLSDLDGVLVDTGSEVERVWREWAIEQGLDPEEIVGAMHGVPARHVIAAMAPHLDPVTEAERVDRIHAQSPADALPGAAELLSTSPLAVVTACSPPLAAARFRAAGLPQPAVIVTSHDTDRGKPHPDPYLAGAAALGVEPSACVVIEDAPAGVAAGRAAGMTVWAVTTTHTAAELEGAHEIAADVAALLPALDR
jgi:mannitol-1-/sugar-/sorbitol-6-phosphatase